MAGEAVRIEGASELRRALRDVAGGLADLKDAHREVGQIVADRATTIAPRRSGRLAGSVRAARQASGAIVRAGRSSLPYAGVIHFGWPAHNIEPQPFLYDALDDRRNQVIDAYERRINALNKPLL